MESSELVGNRFVPSLDILRKRNEKMEPICWLWPAELRAGEVFEAVLMGRWAGVGRQREGGLQREKRSPCTCGWHPAMVWENHPHRVTFPQTL